MNNNTLMIDRSVQRDTSKFIHAISAMVKTILTAILELCCDTQLKE